jgi:hypothetical protein
MESEYAPLSNAEEDHVLTDEEMYVKARKLRYVIPPLIHAIGKKNKYAIRMLLYDEDGFLKPDLDINQTDLIGNTPLITAARTGQEDIVRLLLDDTNIDIDAKNVFGYTALVLADANGYKNIVTLLDDKKHTRGEFELGKISLDYGGKRKHRKKKTSKKTRKTSKKTRKGRSRKHKK